MNERRNLARALPLGRVALIGGALLLTLSALAIWAGVTVVQWLSGPARQLGENGSAAAAAAFERLDRDLPALADRAAGWLALEPAAERPGREVSGIDPPQASRAPGLVRSGFERDAQGLRVSYRGTASLDAVLAHYQAALADAGFAHTVLSASPASEHHRFERGGEVVELQLAQGPAQSLEVVLSTTPNPLENQE